MYTPSWLSGKIDKNLRQSSAKYRKVPQIDLKTMLGRLFRLMLLSLYINRVSVSFSIFVSISFSIILTIEAPALHITGVDFGVNIGIYLGKFHVQSLDVGTSVEAHMIIFLLLVCLLEVAC